MNLRRPELWILVVSIAAGAWLFTRPGAPPPGGGAPRRLAPALAALPPGAQLLCRIDLARLRRSRIGAALFGHGRSLTGLGGVTDVCGFDPTEQVQELALATPAQPPQDEPRLGIVATGDFHPERLLECAAKLIVRRGGTPSDNPIGSFRSVRDRAREGPEVAVRAGGPVLVGEGAYFRAMIDAADGRGPTLLGDEAHATLREAVGSGVVTVTFVTRPGWLERWVTTEEARGAPLGAVRAGALRLDVEPTPRVILLLSCPGAEVCGGLGKWAEGTQRRARAGLADELGVDPVAEAKVAVETGAVRVVLELDEAALHGLLFRLAAEEPAGAPSAQ